MVQHHRLSTCLMGKSLACVGKMGGAIIPVTTFYSPMVHHLWPRPMFHKQTFLSDSYRRGRHKCIWWFDIMWMMIQIGCSDGLNFPTRSAGSLQPIVCIQMIATMGTILGGIGSSPDIKSQLLVRTGSDFWGNEPNFLYNAGRCQGSTGRSQNRTLYGTPKFHGLSSLSPFLDKANCWFWAWSFDPWLNTIYNIPKWFCIYYVYVYYTHTNRSMDRWMDRQIDWWRYR